MTIPGGGGGGKKIPPGGTPPKTTTATPTTTKTPSTPPTSAPPAPKPSDGFERSQTDPRLASERAHLPPALETTTTTTSGIDSMVRVLEETRSQILDEHKLLREKSIRLVSELSKAGWERALVEQKRQELSDLRERLANLRKRLQHIQRRLKTALSKSHKHGDLDVNKAIAAHLEKMKRLEPGVQKALLALVAMEQAFAGSVDGGVLKLIGDASAEERGSALARLSPGSIIARATTSLLTSAVIGEGRRLSASTEGAAIDVADELGTDLRPDLSASLAALGREGLSDLASALLTSFDKIEKREP